MLDAVKNFDPEQLCFYTRIYDEGKKSIFSVKLSEIYNVLEKHKDGDKVTLKYYQASTGKETEEEITLAADK